MRVYGLRNGIPHESGFQADGTYIPNPYYMQEAIDATRKYLQRGQHPVGAVVSRTLELKDINTGQMRAVQLLAGVGVNEVVNQSSAHAEMVAIEKAESYHGRRQLEDLQGVLYTTHEPCPMCAGVIANSKLRGIVFGTSAEDAAELVRTEGIKWRSNEVSGLDVIRGRIEQGTSEQFIIGGFMRDECLDVLRSAGGLALGAPSS